MSSDATTGTSQTSAFVRQAPPHVFVYSSGEGRQDEVEGGADARLLEDAVDRVILEGTCMKGGNANEETPPSPPPTETFMRVTVRPPGLQTHVMVPVRYTVRRDREGAMYVDVSCNAAEIGQAGVVEFVKIVTRTRDVFGHRKILVVENVHLLSRVPMLSLKRIVETAARSCWILFSSRTAGCLDPALASRFRRVNASPMPMPMPGEEKEAEAEAEAERHEERSEEAEEAARLVNRIRRLTNPRHLLGVRVSRRYFEKRGDAARLIDMIFILKTQIVPHDDGFCTVANRR